jgi:hypothetical protein
MNKEKLQEFFKTTYELQEIYKIEDNDLEINKFIEKNIENDALKWANFSHKNISGKKDYIYKIMFDSYRIQKESKLNKLVGEMK